MSMIDHDKFRGLVTQLYATVNELEAMFPGRHFTPDGHMVGSLGECLVADAYNLELKTASNKGYDAVTETGQRLHGRRGARPAVPHPHGPVVAP